MSSKGQVVIPLRIRKRLQLQDGETLSVSTENNLIVLKKVHSAIEKEDLKTLAEIKEAWKEIGEGKYRKTNSKDFLKEISQW